jgi:molybdopterin-guanine dinucleotide biosynthesis protein B
MIPVFSIVSSSSKAGKTTVLCSIIKELKSRGYKVCTIKHDVHGFEIDHPGKDTWKHAQAGSDIVVISSPKKMAVIEKVEREYSLDELVGRISGVDIIITEGYKNENKPKLKILGKEKPKETLSKDQDVFAVITDTPADRDVPQFAFSEIKEAVDLIVSLFLK